MKHIFYPQKKLTPDELIEGFSECTLENFCFSPSEIMNVLQEVAVKEDDETFKKVVDEYFFCINRCFKGKQYPTFFPLRDIGEGSVIIDIKNNYIKPSGHLGEDYFLNESSYGPTMNAFARYVGASGKDLVALVFEEGYGNV